MAIVTGAAGGIGRAIAARFAADGAHVVVADRDGEGAAQVAKALGRAHATAFEVDVADEASAARLVAHAESLGQLVAAINNAAVAQREADDDERELRRVFGVNLDGVRHAMKHQIRAMLERGAGAIVNVASNAAIHPLAGQPMYSASKAAVIGLSRSVARVVAREGIRINVLCPGSVDTPMLRRSWGGDAGVERLISMNPTGRIGAPEDLAGAAAWLCGEDSKYLVGHVLVVDGGEKAW